MLSGAWNELPSGSRIVGPYGLLDVIGEGGMGIVYRAEHMETRERVAIKTLRVPHERHLESLRREIFALRRIRHPGIVRILDEGVQSGVPWYAMELLRGETLGDYNRRVWASVGATNGDGGGRPVAAGHLDHALGIAQGLCTALAVLHSEGIVHRDLKAANVLLRDDGSPVLIDFGLMWRFPSALAREVLEVAAELAGTAGYMAPEQIGGESVDARADIYSMGCILYELLAGRLPYVNEPLVQKLTRPPMPPSQHVRGVPPELDALVLRLLERRARDRIGHAADVVYALDAVFTQKPPVPRASVSPRAYVYRPALVGREDTIAALTKPLEALEVGRGGFVLVRGESGIGKTCVVMAVARRAAGRGAQVVAGTPDSLGASPAVGRRNEAPLHPFGRFLEAVADKCLAGGCEATERLLGARARVLAAYESRFAGLPGVDEHPEPPELPAQAARERCFQALAETLAAYSAEWPTLLVLDDLHWADELSLQFLSWVDADFLARHALLVLATYRAEEVSDTLAALGARPHVLEVSLGRLDHATVTAIASDMLGLDGPPPHFVHTLAERSEGNPFFAGEYVRAAVEQGLVRRDASGRWRVTGDGAELPLPRTLRELVQRRLELLSPDARALVEVASVVGREVDVGFLAHVADSPSDALRGAVRELLARQILEEPEPGRLRFLHDKLREHTYDQVERGRRRAMHLATARALEARAGAEGKLPRRYAQLAYHYAETDEHARTLEYLEKAGEAALGAFANGEAIRFLTRALDLDQTTGARGPALRRARWERQLADAHYALGDLDAALAHCRRALEQLGQPPPSSARGWLLQLARHAALQTVHRWRPGWAVAGETHERESAREASSVSQRMAVRFYFSFDALPMIASSLRAVNFAERAGSGVSAGASYGMLAATLGISKLSRLGDLYFESARGVARATNDRAGLCFALYARAAWRICDGAWDEVRDLCGEAVEAATAPGVIADPQDVAMCDTFFGHLAFYTGRFEESRRVYDELAAASRTRGNDQLLAWGLYASARALLPLGELEQARAKLLDAHTLLERQNDAPSRIICPGLLALVHLALGDDERADAFAGIAQARIRRNAPTVFSTVDGYAAVAEVRIEQWRRAIGEGGQARAARARMRRSLASLALLALNVPIGRPYFHRLRGRSRLVAGRDAAARRSFERALAASKRLAMPYQEALAELELGALEPRGDARRRRLARAEELFVEMKCAGLLARVRALAG